MEKLVGKLPMFQQDAFGCPHCGAYAHMTWYDTMASRRFFIESLMACFCQRCDNFSLWVNEQMIYPNQTAAPLPNEDLPEDVKKDYLEAGDILQKSPRGAAALLRLCVQKLCISLGEKGKDLDKDIGNLVKKGLPSKLQKAFDVVRITGNEAVHPGSLDLNDNYDIASNLFDLVNLIAEKMISEDIKINDIYEKMPEQKRNAVETRDKTTQ